MMKRGSIVSKPFGSIRTIIKDGESWFIAADVCKALGLDNITNALSRLDEDEKMTFNSNKGHSGQRGGAQFMCIVNESGLYSLILGSRKPEAKAFKRWITHEVIPSIRKIHPALYEKTRKAFEPFGCDLGADLIRIWLQGIPNM